MMSGPYRWAVLLDRTHMRVSHYEAPEIVKFNPFDISQSEINSLHIAAEILDADCRELVWMFFANVS